MNFEKKITLIKALRKAGVMSAKELSDFVADPMTLLSSGLSVADMKEAVSLAAKVGKTNPFFDWLMSGDSVF